MSKIILFSFIFILFVFLDNASGFGVTPYRNSYYPYGPYSGGRYPGSYPPWGGAFYRDACPVCDSSVFSYCSRKLVHDYCCCGEGYYDKSIECQYADCGFIYANSCKESELIATCCCDELNYRSYDPFYGRYFNKK